MHTLSSFGANLNQKYAVRLTCGPHTPRGPAVPLLGTAPIVTLVCFGLLTILTCSYSVINGCQSSSKCAYNNLRPVRNSRAMQVVE